MFAARTVVPCALIKRTKKGALAADPVLEAGAASRVVLGAKAFTSGRPSLGWHSLAPSPLAPLPLRLLGTE
jgi:hypothetical protein